MRDGGLPAAGLRCFKISLRGCVSMKRFVSLLLSAVLLLGLFAGCRKEPAVGTQTPDQWPGAAELAEAVFSRSGFDGDTNGLERLSADKDEAVFLSDYLANAYGLEDPWRDAAVVRGTGMSAFEVAVVRMEDEEAAARAAGALADYRADRQGDFAGYAPAEAELAARGSINQVGPFAALFICPDTASADAAFQAAVNGDLMPSQPVEGPTVEADVDAVLGFLYGQVQQYVSDDAVEWLDDSDLAALGSYISGSYGLGGDQWEDAAIVRGTGELAFELAVLRVKDEAAAWDMMDVLSNYLFDREARFASYAPDQEDLLHQAVVRSVMVGSDGTFVLLLACEDPEQAFNKLTAALQPDSIGVVDRYGSGLVPWTPEADSDYPDRVKFVQPNEDDMSLYDTSAIRAAWESEDPSSLSSYDRDIYNVAKRVLGQVLDNGMSDLEKETAIYSWVVNNVDYDWTHQDVMRETPRESFTPYGGLVNHAAVCLGYAATFQLLCDLAGVECITVVGAAFFSQEDHGWNMVQLDGKWYCVDVTWDANHREQGAVWGTSGPDRWRYFNITSDEMAETDHQWDYANTPEAVTKGNGRG